MSTAELFLDQDEIKEFIRETLASDYLYSIGEEGAQIGLCPYITFYVYHRKEDFLRVSEQMITIYREFEQIIDEPFQLIWKDKSQDWLKADDKRLPTDLLAHAKECADDEYTEFWMKATDRDSVIATPRWGFSAEVVSNVDMRYTTLKLTFRHRWYNRNQTRWHAFVADCLQRLQPDQCYSGFEVGNGGFSVLGNYECETLERICADYFYGMDIDHTSDMGFQYFNDEDGWVNPARLGAGLRTPVWSFLLSPNWLKRLGKSAEEVRITLNDPRIVIEEIPFALSKINPEGLPGLWIRLGELDLHPVEHGVPELLVKANNLIRPVRCDELKLLSLDAWDDDPNPRFGYEDSIRWMRRFDDDSDWPEAVRRKPPAGRSETHLRCEALHPCPKEGWWFTPAKADSRRHFRSGETMPDLSSAWGLTIWQWDEQQIP